ncbi:MAG: DUF4923 family protein [Porphyromonadaceae bacterium]|jgi:hypothetical protein|nr:DUF4923 family protein [Porphyromonadaceae bacterium]
MKKLTIILAAVMLALGAQTASAWKLSDLFGGQSAGETVTSLIEGVFSTSKIDIKDMAGEWTVEGSAVSFKSENFLQQAGGIAVATAVESKLNPYYKKYGLTGAKLTIDAAGNFTLKLKRASISGVIVKDGDGNFTFQFQALKGLFTLGQMTAYVQKTPQSMDIMFNADEMKKVLSTVSAISGSKLVSAASQILNSYDGMYVGFSTKLTGRAPAVQTPNNQNQQQNQQQGNGLFDVINGLFGR